MPSRSPRSSSTFARARRGGVFVVAVGLLTAAPSSQSQPREPADGRVVIAGRIVDPHHAMTADAILMLGHAEGDSFSSRPLPIGIDGSFVSPRLEPGTYVLEVVRSPHSAREAATPTAVRIVTLGHADVTGLEVEVRKDVELEGRFRMESDNPATPWPDSIVVLAQLALDGPVAGPARVARGAANGRFVLHNAFGRRVLRCGYRLSHGNHWWPSRVLLDGIDITNVPTDFSRSGGRRLEVVFTQHPPGLAGTVLDSAGRTVPYGWVAVVAEDPARRHRWSTMMDAVQADRHGAFQVVLTGGRYLARAFPPMTFPSPQVARAAVLRMAQDGTPVEVLGRERRRVQLTIGDGAQR